MESQGKLVDEKLNLNENINIVSTKLDENPANIKTTDQKFKVNWPKSKE